MVADRLRSEHDATLAAQGLGQRRGHHDVGRPGEAEFVQQPSAARSAHSQTVGLVDQQQGAMPAAHLMQFAQRRKCTVGTEYGVGDHQSPFFVAGAQRRLDRAGVQVGTDDHPGPGQPARIDQ